MCWMVTDKAGDVSESKEQLITDLMLMHENIRKKYIMWLIILCAIFGTIILGVVACKLLGVFINFIAHICK